MAEEQNPNQKDPNEEGKSEFHKVTDKVKELKNDPTVKATQSLFTNYFLEIFYLVATVIAFIYSLIHSPSRGLIFIGIGFILGTLLHAPMKHAARSLSGFLKNQELVVHIIMVVIAVILAFIIPTIMLGILIGIPAGFGVRQALVESKRKP